MTVSVAVIVRDAGRTSVVTCVRYPAPTKSPYGRRYMAAITLWIPYHTYTVVSTKTSLTFSILDNP